MSRTPELSQIVSQEVLGHSAALGERFASAGPFRHVIIDGFLNTSFCADLLQQFPRFDEKRAINENGEVGGKSTQERVRALGGAYCQLDDIVQGREFLALIETITGIENLQYDPHYYGGGTHENRQGQDLDPHVDFNFHPITRQHRRLNLIIYLNEFWQDVWGGSLQLHRDPYCRPSEDDIITVTPLLNRCVIFETNEYSWHGFERIALPPDQQHLSRKSFALYFYTDTRPATETAEEHSTVYVDRHLPERFQPGLTLDGEDMQVIRLLMARRDQHLKRLYRYIHRLYGDVNRLKAQNLVPLADGNAQVPEAGAQGAAAEPMIRALKARVWDLEHSTSWRITAPLRAIKRLLSGTS